MYYVATFPRDAYIDTRGALPTHQPPDRTTKTNQHGLDA